MKTKRFNSALLFSLFGVTLGFFGMLYEAVVLIPQMIIITPEKIKFWHNYYSEISPIIYYIPVVPVATMVLVILYFISSKQNNIKRTLLIAVICQVIALLITFYMVNQINLKLYFSDIENYAHLLSARTQLMNIMSIIRLVFASIALWGIFRSYLKAYKMA